MRVSLKAGLCVVPFDWCGAVTRMPLRTYQAPIPKLVKLQLFVTGISDVEMGKTEGSPSA